LLGRGLAGVFDTSRGGSSHSPVCCERRGGGGEWVVVKVVVVVVVVVESSSSDYPLLVSYLVCVLMAWVIGRRAARRDMTCLFVVCFLDKGRRRVVVVVVGKTSAIAIRQARERGVA